jgi:hypothetical protein
VLGQPTPPYSRHEVILRCDAHGWSIPSDAPRFLRVRKRLGLAGN